MKKIPHSAISACIAILLFAALVLILRTNVGVDVDLYVGYTDSSRWRKIIMDGVIAGIIAGIFVSVINAVGNIYANREKGNNENIKELKYEIGKLNKPIEDLRETTDYLKSQSLIEQGRKEAVIKHGLDPDRAIDQITVMSEKILTLTSEHRNLLNEIKQLRDKDGDEWDGGER